MYRVRLWGPASARLPYQLAFLTPGISPSSARLRKQIRQIPNLRYTARGRPQSPHRRSLREENFGVRSAFTIFALLAMPSDPFVT